MILFSRSVARLFKKAPVCLLIAWLLMASACSQQENSTTGSKQAPSERMHAQKIYTELCAGCHGVQARGGVGPDLTVSRFKYGKNRLAIEKSILDGRSGGMPAFGSHLKPEEAVALAEYLLSL